MKKSKLWNGFGVLFFVVGMTLLYWQYQKTHHLFFVFDPETRAWRERIRQALENPASKIRLEKGDIPSRSLASEGPIVEFKGKYSNYRLKDNEAINLQKQAGEQAQHRLLVVNEETGEQAILSGEVILTTDDIQHLPSSHSGIKFEVLRTLSENRYLVGITPAIEIQKGIDIINKLIKVNDLQTDIVHRKIRPE